MRHIPKYSFFIIMSVGIAVTSCKKGYLDINKDPNRVTDDNVTAELIFPAGAEGVGAANVGARANGVGANTSMQFAQSWVGYMAANGTFARNPIETSYNIDFTFGDALFQTRYDVLFDLHQAEVKALAGNDTSLAAASMILSAKMFQDVVDIYGDIPYSQAFQVGRTTRPAYDKSQDIYNTLQLRLDTAIKYLKLPIPAPVAKKFAAADIVNKGNRGKWIKFANTLKLRLLIRQSEISGFNPSAEIAKIFPNGTDETILLEGESVSENPGYVNDVDKQSPFFANYGFTPTNIIATSSQNANAYIINLLGSNNDNRIFEFFTPVGNAFVGDAYGDEPGNIPSSALSSYFGPGLVRSATEDQWIVPSYESLFFEAEARARGWLADDGGATYKRAVIESFVWIYGPDNVNGSAVTDANAYLTNAAIADYTNAGASVSQKVRFIALQKYIANTCIDPLESWSDQRRLNFMPPGFISLNPSRIGNKLPLRLLYPQSEYTTNSVNVLKVGTIDAFTTKLFWEP